MNPITSATVSGVGQTPLGPVEGTWVVGFFQDGEDGSTTYRYGDFVERFDTGVDRPYGDIRWRQYV